MKYYIKKLNIDFNDWDIIDNNFSKKLIQHLKNGFAIKIYNQNLPTFFNIITEQSDIILNTNITSYKNNYYYFILIGNRIYHSHKPFIGNTKIDTWIPTFP